MDKVKVRVPNLVWVLQVFARCYNIEGCEDYVRYGKSRNYFWDVPVVDLLTYLFEPRRWASKIVAILQNAKVCNLQFILNRAILLKWKPELINWQKMKYMRDLNPVCTTHAAHCVRPVGLQILVSPLL